MKRLLAVLVLLPALAFGQGLPIKGGASTDLANVDTNKNLKVTLPTDTAQAGYGKLAGKDGSPLKVTATGYAEASLDSMEFMDTIDGASVNTNLWAQSTSTMTITQAAGFINLNPTNSVAINTYAILSTIQSFYLSDCLPLHIHLRTQSSLWNLPANTVFEFGWGTATTNATPTDGIFIRARAGTVYAVMNFGGSETELALTPAAMAVPTVNVTSEWVLDLYANELRVFLDGTLIAAATIEGRPTTMQAPTSLPAATTNNRQPIFFRVFNTASAPGSSPTLRLGQISVQHRNAQLDKPWVDKLVGMARGGYQNPTTFGATSNHTNSTSPTSATLSNTAAGYTTLGGRFQFAAPAGAATDFALFGYQVPAGYQLFCHHIAISSCNTGAAVATTATMLDWGIGTNSSAVSLATADGAGTWAPRRIPVGTQAYIVAAGIGVCAPDIMRDIHVVTDSGRFLHVIVQVPVGTATGSQVIRGDVTLTCWFE